LDKNVLARLTAEVVSSYVGNSSLSEGELDRAIEKLPQLIDRVHEALSRILSQDESIEPATLMVALRNATGPADLPEEPRLPAISIENSVQDDHIVCLEDGRKLKTLARHLRTHHGLTPEAYRQRWNLPDDYPMACPSYAQSRSEVARRIGLGVEGRGSKPAYVQIKDGATKSKRGREKVKP
jgi:predicted transcriptional regulator